jgi:predicted RNase H-like HicB family nuclease
MVQKYVKIGRFGSELREFAFDDGETVEDLLTAAKEVLKKGETITIDGETVSKNYVLKNKDVIIVEASTTGA